MIMLKTLCCRVVNIYQVTRAAENVDFRSEVGNVQLLSHASRVENFVGILSRSVNLLFLFLLLLMEIC